MILSCLNSVSDWTHKRIFQTTRRFLSINRSNSVKLRSDCVPPSTGLNSRFHQVPTVLQRTIRTVITMGNWFSQTPPDRVAKSLECPVCLDTIKNPPIHQCEKGHGLCSTCRQTLKDQDKPCPVCRGKLTDTRNFALENVLEQLPKIKCKYSGCTFQKSDAQQVKIHEEECREKRVFCELCWMGIAMSKLFSHLETKHRMKRYGSKTSLGQEFWIRTLTKGRGFIPLSKVNDFEFIVNRKSCGEEGIVMFWISLNGSAKEANQYEYTLKLWNKDRTKILALKSTKCLSVDMWRGNKAMALLLSRDDEKKAENNKELWLTLLIKKK